MNRAEGPCLRVKFVPFMSARNTGVLFYDGITGQRELARFEGNEMGSDVGAFHVISSGPVFLCSVCVGDEFRHTTDEGYRI